MCRLDAIYEEMVWKMDEKHLLHDASIDSSMNKVFLQSHHVMTWEKIGGSSLIHYIMYVAPNYKTILFAEERKHTHQ